MTCARLQHLAIFPDLVLALLRAHEGCGIDVLKPDEDRVAAGPRRLLDEARNPVAERVDLKQKPDPKTLVLAQFDQPVEDRLPVAVAGEIVVRDEEAGHALRGVGAHDRLDVVRGPIARLAPLDIDDGAEAALERAAASGVEAGIVPGDPGHDLARQHGNGRGGHVGHVVEIAVDRLRLARIDVLEELSQAAFALPCVEDHAQCLSLLEVRRQFRQHGDAAGDVETANRDRHALLAELAADVEGARELVRLHADQRDHAAIGQDALRDRGDVDNGVALVVDLERDIDAGAKHTRLRAFKQQAIDASEAVRGNGRAAPLNDIAVVVVMRRLDQNDRELGVGH
jgi:hypothetical protein